ncbi:MAG: hypothetical protein KDG89_06745 [Geminicoccaceae bacterium]|nr:hypothetical protein [Geminicoccaceae bacterium]
MSGGAALIAMMALSATSTMVAAEAQARQAESASDAAKYNAAVEKQNADLALTQGAAEEGRLKRQHRAANAEFRASTGGLGIGLTGSALDLYHDNLKRQDLEVRDLRYGTLLQSRGLLADAELTRFQGKAQKVAARNARVGGVIGAGASAMTAYGTYGKAGMLGGRPAATATTGAGGTAP